MGIIVLILASLALFIPKTGLWISLSWVNYLLMIVMFGMGLTLRIEDFKLVFTRPKDILIGCLAQFIIMPSLAFLLSKIFGLDAGLMAGVVLVGTCPGGTASNVITYLSKVCIQRSQMEQSVKICHTGKGMSSHAVWL